MEWRRNKYMKLSKEQQKIVEHIEGAILVKAGPGSGKTRVIIERVKNILMTQKHSKILALTFSNLAADELRNRLEEYPSLNDMLENIRSSTIHSFCLDIVQTRGNLVGLNQNMVIFDKIVDLQAILRNVFLNNIQLKSYLQQQDDPDQYLKKCLNTISDQKKKYITPKICTLEYPFPIIYRNYNQILLDQNALDFDDILFYAYKILSENPNVVYLFTSLYKYICVDEAQDLNFTQYELLKVLCGNNYKNIMLVGDENQSIYGFNGSNSKFMTISFVKDFKPKIYTLNENYRSAKAIVEFSNKLEESSDTTNYAYDGELSAFSFINEEKESDYVIEKINDLIKCGHKDVEGQLNYENFAIIARNRYVFTNIESKLNKLKIPYHYKKTISGIENESEYMQVFSLSIQIMINKQNIIHLQELCRISNADFIDASSSSTNIEILERILSDTKFNTLLSAIIYLKEDCFNFKKSIADVEDNMPEDINYNEKSLIMHDIDEWKRHWQNYCNRIPIENRSLISFRNSISLGKTHDDVSEKGVSLLSVHMSKGLQYEVVFIMGLTEGTFPDYRAVKKGGMEMEQEKNNMYVAVTRAKRLCYLTFPLKKNMPWGGVKVQEPSRFIREIIITNILE